MNNGTNNIFKAGIVIAIALALILPGAAMAANMKTLATKNTQSTPIAGDGGWVEQATGFYEADIGIGYMHAVDENIVWASGYDGSGSGQSYQDFTMTINGGDEWNPGTVDNAEGLDFAMIVAVNENYAWTAMYTVESGDPQGIFHTSDGGNTWAQQASAAFSGAGAFPNCVHFWNENDGWCQGDPVDGYFEMYTTTDGGDTWVRVPQGNIPDPLPGEWGTVGYYDVVGDTVWFGTQNGGRVFKSTDKGYTWTVATTPFPSGAYVDIRFKDQNNGLAMDKNFEFAELAETSDGGATWTTITYSGVCYGADFDYVPGTDNMYVSTGVNANDPAYQGASYSLDGGHIWTTWDEMSGTQLFGTTWVDGTIGWAGNFNVDEFTGGMYKYTPSADPDLYCSGDIEWVDVAPGETVTDSFTVQNIGAAGTELDWEIESYPDWGTWTFNPDGGLDLTPEDGAVTVTVEVVAPDESETEFTGEIVLVNSEDPDDTCTIDVALATPVSQQSLILQFLERFAERFPNAFPILRHLLGL